MATSSSREERRRKIMSRGSDRLAFITGRCNSLPSDRDSPRIFSSDHRPDPPTISVDHRHDPPSTAGILVASASKVLKRDTDVRVSGAKKYDEIVNQIDPQDDTSEQAPAVEDMTKSEPSLAKSMVQNPSNVTKLVPEPSRINQVNLFTCQQVNSCIISSQNTRSFCALMIALLVVLSYIDYPIFGINKVNSEWIAASRPLCILLLTDVTIVLAQLFHQRRTHPEEGEKERVTDEEEVHDLTQAVQVMEKGLLMYQIVRAVFIDFSIYAVVVVCGLSLV